MCTYLCNSDIYNVDVSILFHTIISSFVSLSLLVRNNNLHS